jgi:hypothetical protein
MLRSHRSAIVGLCFALWLGAAALACETFTPRQLGPEIDSVQANSPVIAAQVPAHPNRAVDSDSLQAAAVTLAKR